MRRRHLCVVLGAVGRIERWRADWDPVMAAAVPAHVTVAYPEETADERLLIERAEQLAADGGPFRLGLGEVRAVGDGTQGVYVAVDDVDGGWARLRTRLLAPPLLRRDLPAHVTLAHPRTSARGASCWAALAGRYVGARVTVGELLRTETEYRPGMPPEFTVVRRFPLHGAQAA
ncbi:2'-5' RNA ligase family protein [Streptomyces indicus]|uniref:2'-5' RNA ligase superfamily protein n=1 Tax=Streptomyces indicus TaxID=417292 RepID=A0A1G8ZN46_9ACTN|nr:2'-5' RNA ligase family protein [Streptomyces indicus]SDK16539.1 2'-5' RNA ligase superfamily protein [Streptomyces indicus]